MPCYLNQPIAIWDFLCNMSETLKIRWHKKFHGKWTIWSYDRLTVGDEVDVHHTNGKIEEVRVGDFHASGYGGYVYYVSTKPVAERKSPMRRRRCPDCGSWSKASVTPNGLGVLICPKCGPGFGAFS